MTILPVRDAAHLEAAIAVVGAAQDPPFPPDDWHFDPIRAAYPADGDAMFVAEDVDGSVVGAALGRRDGSGVRVAILGVDAAHQGRGIGRALMEAITRAALDAGEDRLSLGAVATAEDFYARLGYRVCGRKSEDDQAVFEYVRPGAIVVRHAHPQDLPGMLELAAEVEPLFGPMPDFATYAMRGIDRWTVPVISDEHGTVLGAALLSRDDRPHHINWLSVRESERGRGHGRRLLEWIMRFWPEGDIDVVTFPVGLAGGEAAIGLYEAFGFERIGAAEAAPDGTARDLYRLRR